MMEIVTVEQMLTIERSADAGGLSYDQMMHNAGQGIAEWVYQHLACKPGVIGLVGSGNNGGDTIIALTCLATWGVRTIAFLVKPRGEDALLDRLRLHGGAVIDISDNMNFDVLQASLIPGVVVLDGILGTGLKLPLRGRLHELMVKIHACLENRLDVRKIAVDCPSGCDCDTGEVSDVTIPVEHTLTMAAMKQGLLHHPARAYSGDLHWIGIGIDDISEHITEELPTMIDLELIGALLPKRPESGHKGTFGTCLVLSGSVPYTGAAYLTGKSAYRAGCGLVHMATGQAIQRALAGELIEAVWTILPNIEDGYDSQGVGILEHVLSRVDAMVLGPGWGLSDYNTSFLDALLGKLPHELPILLDADGLKMLSKLDRWWTRLPKHAILTPHPGEMSVLTGLSIDEIQSDRWAVALAYAQRWNQIVVLKGAVTVIASPEGGIFVNPTSNPALATAGSGDVLSGLIGGLLAQGVPALSASILGVWIHGTAGEIAGKMVGTDFGTTAVDILDCLPKAMVTAKEAGE